MLLDASTFLRLARLTKSSKREKCVAQLSAFRGSALGGAKLFSVQQTNKGDVGTTLDDNNIAYDQHNNTFK